MSASSLLHLALTTGFGIGRARAVGACEGSTCQAQPEDGSLMQLDRLGVKAGVQAGLLASAVGAGDRSSLVWNSKPYLEEGRTWGGNSGKVLINEDGVLNEYFLPGADTRNGGRTIRYSPPYRFYLMKRHTTDYSQKENFYMPSLLNKTLSVDFEMTRNGPSCGCYLNFYLVDMPAPSEGYFKDYYCDGHCYEGLGCCPELDLSLGNMNAQQVKTRACTGDYENHPSWKCNKDGDPRVGTSSREFNPNPGATIDSSRPFTYSQTFGIDRDGLMITTVISQGRNRVVKQMGPGSSQLNAMLPQLEKGMAFVTGYWFAEETAAIDGETCGDGPQTCNMRPAYLHNWAITSTGGHLPPQSCFLSGIEFHPLNMHGQGRSHTYSAAECQQRCLGIEGCRYFTWWADGGCHLQDASAQEGPGFAAAAGPAFCESQTTTTTRLATTTTTTTTTTPPYVAHLGTNCYHWHGATDIDNDWNVSLGFSVQQCEQFCTSDPFCDCVVHLPGMDYKNINGADKCWRRHRCELAQCETNTRYNVYFKQRGR